MLDAVWDDLIKVYFAPKSEDDLIMINKIAFIMGQLRNLVSAAEHSHISEDIKGKIIGFAKNMLLPNIEEYKKILGNMDDYFVN